MSDSPWRSALPLVAGRGASALIGVLLPAVLARGLDQADYGTYKQLFIVSNLALYMLQLGLAQSLFFFVPRAAGEEERRAWLGQTQLLLAGLGLFAFALLTLLAPLIAARFSNPALAAIALPMGILCGAMVVSCGLEIGLTARRRPGLSALVLVLSDLLRVGAMLGPVLLGWGLSGLAWGAALAALVRVGVSLWVMPPRLGSLSRQSLRTQLSYALPFGLSVLVSLPQQQMHLLVVAALASPALFALYSVGCLQIPVVGLLYSPVSETMQVRLGLLKAQGSSPQAAEVFSQAVSQLAGVFLPLCVFLALVAEPALELLYGPAYLASAAVFQIAVASVAVSSLPLEGLLKALGKTRTLLAAGAGKLLLSVPTVFAGYSLFGMRGAISAHVIVESLGKLALLLLASRALDTPVRALVSKGLLSGLRRALLVALAAAAGLRAMHAPLAELLAAGALSALALGLEHLFLSRLSASDRAQRRAA